MLAPALEEKLSKARLALAGATSESLVELCQQYLALLAQYRSALYTLPATFDLNPSRQTSEIREIVRAAIEQTTVEREWTEALLRSFTMISGYGAVETFNRQQYKGRDDWQLKAGGVSFRDETGLQKMTVQEAVETASLLRREEHVAGNSTRAGARPVQLVSKFPTLREAQVGEEAHDNL